ncbi:MAG: hypothetical protein LBR80_17215 [Deltaproteobacteria bacterium]|nr:hypothetical protein [Deltaproteobacteria bacterium]
MTITKPRRTSSADAIRHLWEPHNDDADMWGIDPFSGNFFGNIDYDLIFLLTGVYPGCPCPMPPQIRVGPDFHNTISVSIEPEPKVISPNANVHVSRPVLGKIKEMVSVNRLVLLDYWDGKCCTFGCMDQIIKVC